MTLRRTLVLAALPTLALLLLAAPAGAGSDVQIDFDQAFDFSSVHSYAWRDDPKRSLSQDNPFLHERIVEVVDGRLYRAGVKKVQEDGDPDAYIAYRVAINSDMAIAAEEYGYFYPASWYWSPAAWSWATPNMPTERTYTKGTLLFEVWSARTKQMIWRGSGQAQTTTNLDKMNKRIFDLIIKISDKWRGMRADQEKDRARAAGS
ncbi:MAG TPA: DUF4136 domain-containing protein [Candidatus Polarisedimenticolia bacterium]|nr:DUF4136 domain-containing protein [Candidatus Polarisedimenticolia bacterium]